MYQFATKNITLHTGETVRSDFEDKLYAINFQIFSAPDFQIRCLRVQHVSGPQRPRAPDDNTQLCSKDMQMQKSIAEQMTV